MRQGDIRIGVSGWTYAPWRGAFYPEGLPQKRELEYASSALRSIEINGTFYGMQTPDAFARWAEETPDDFLFAVKGSRYITHMRRQKDCAVPLANFFASGVLRLGPKLGPILWQFPPNFRFDEQRLADFFAMLPHDGDAASALARKHDDRLKARAWLRAKDCPPLRHAIEIRQESFVDPAFTALLRKYDIALVCADTVEWPLLMDATSDFVYCRLHGSEKLYHSAYGDAAITRWSRRVAAWSQGRPMTDGRFIDSRQKNRARDVFVYFDNTDKLHAPDDARSLMAKLGQASMEPAKGLPPTTLRKTAKAKATAARAAA